MEQEQEQEQKLGRYKRKAALDHHADQHQAGAEGVADGGSVHAGEDIGHPVQPDRADDEENPAAANQNPGDDIANQIESKVREAVGLPSTAPVLKVVDGGLAEKADDDKKKAAKAGK